MAPPWRQATSWVALGLIAPVQMLPVLVQSVMSACQPTSRRHSVRSGRHSGLAGPEWPSLQIVPAPVRSPITRHRLDPRLASGVASAGSTTRYPCVAEYGLSAVQAPKDASHHG